MITTIESNHVLCIGAPRIHEAIKESFYPKIKSLMLDIDKRYVSCF